MNFSLIYISWFLLHFHFGLGFVMPFFSLLLGVRNLSIVLCLFAGMFLLLGNGDLSIFCLSLVPLLSI